MKRQRKRSSVFSSGTKTAKKRASGDISAHTQKIPKVTSSGRTSNKSKKKIKFITKYRKQIILGIFAVVIVVFGILSGMYVAINREIKEMDFENIALNYSSVVYSQDELGNSYELEQLYDDGHRIWIDGDQIPDVMKEALVSIEDERFYSHKGFDIKRTFGAFVGWVFEKLGGKNATYGGSTITQQTIKNITHEKERSSIRKIKEIMRATVLEKELSKDEILTLYLNVVFFANNCYGVEAASNMYFDKPAAELTLTEAATIAGITQRPSYYDPIRNPQNALEKRNIVLKKMFDLGKISEEEYNEASASDLGLSDKHLEKRTNVYSYFVDQVINDVISDLQTQKGYSETFAKQQVFNGGLKIYTTMDKNIQKDIEAIFEDEGNFPQGTKAKEAQAAMIIIDPYTGAIKGMVGGKGEKQASRGLNRATQTFRQPGSSFKPLSVYAPSIEVKKLTPASILTDAKITIADWSPKNAYSGFKGDIILRHAIEVSSNTTAVRALQGLGIDISYNYLSNRFHISNLKNEDKNLSSLALGGLTSGVSVEEMAAAYAVFANGGKYIKPYTYTKVLDNTGKLLLENNPKEEKAISPETSYIITNLLTSVVKGTSGTGRLANIPSMNVAGKTGTTNDDKDKWFVGYTPYYVGAVWYGFDTPSSIRAAGVRNNISAQLWGKVMSRVHKNLPNKSFEVPNGVIKATICTNTGALASEGCEFAQSEYFISGTQPSESCKLEHVYPEGSQPTPTPGLEAEPSIEPTEAPIEIPPDSTPDTNDEYIDNSHTPSRPTPNPTNEPDDVVVIPD